jgi:hypothetical protein
MAQLQFNRHILVAVPQLPVGVPQLAWLVTAHEHLNQFIHLGVLLIQAGAIRQVKLVIVRIKI